MDQGMQGELRRQVAVTDTPAAAAAPRINREQLVVSVVTGQIAHPVGRASAYRIGHDGVPRVLPGTGGITLNWRIGDPCIGIAGDHVEPGVALHNNGREVVGPRNGPNLALLTYACVGNRATVLSGTAAGRTGWVTGKHGGIDHVLVDFPAEVLQRLRIGDTIQITSVGLGMRLLDHPGITLVNCSPVLLARWGLVPAGGRLRVPVTHRFPAHLMGSGLGRNTASRGDYDIQLADAESTRRYRLDMLRFGDLVCIEGADARHGPGWRSGRRSIGVVVHADSTVSGHGPGVCLLMTGAAATIEPVHDARANLAAVLGVREPKPPVRRKRLVAAPAQDRIADNPPF
jgi:hypothetical protein